MQRSTEREEIIWNIRFSCKGYVGNIGVSEEDGILFGKVMGIRSLISYEGQNIEELVADFHGAVDIYLETCMIERKEPEAVTLGR